MGRRRGERGQIPVRVGSAVGDCGVQDLGAEQTATARSGAVATEIGVVQVLVEGADISNELTAAFTDFSNKRWSGFGHDLGNIANMMQDLHCNTFVCKIVEGLLNGVGVAYQDLVACEQTCAAPRTRSRMGSRPLARMILRTCGLLRGWTEHRRKVCV